MANESLEFFKLFGMRLDWGLFNCGFLAFLFGIFFDLVS